MQDCKPLRLVHSLRDVEKAGGGRSPLGTQEVEGPLGTLADGRVGGEALILLHPVFPAPKVAGHIRPHIQVEVAAAQVVGEIKLLLVTEGEAFLPEQLYKL